MASTTGSVSSQIPAATSIDQAKVGTRSRFIPWVRSEMTVVAMHTDASSSETITRPVPSSVRAMASASSPVTPSSAPQPPPASTETTRMTAPSSQPQ